MTDLDRLSLKLAAQYMSQDDDWNEPDPEYAEETPVCRHGINHGCEWCEEEKDNER